MGLPGAGHIFGPQMEPIQFAVAANVNLDALKAAGIKRRPIRVEVEAHLDEAAVIFQADIAPHTDCGSTSNGLADHGYARDTTHAAPDC